MPLTVWSNEKRLVESLTLISTRVGASRAAKMLSKTIDAASKRYIENRLLLNLRWLCVVP